METKTYSQSEKGTTQKTAIQKITPFLWFDNQAEEAVNYYMSAFYPQGGSPNRITNVTRYGEDAAKASGMPAGSVMTVAFQINGQEFVAINGGPVFKFTPSLSFFVTCNTEQKINLLWSRLSEGGNILMNLEKKPYSEKYGWVNDKYGVSWQLNLSDGPQKISPCLLFSGDQFGKAEEAINYYQCIFGDSAITDIHHNEKANTESGKSVDFAKFTLGDQELIAMDSDREHAFNFTPAISLVVNCDTQKELDHFWNNLTQGGDERAQQCGWLADKFGVSWQIVPSNLGELLGGPDTNKTGRVMKTMLQMKKIDMNKLKQAYEE